ncbi:MAG: hypothetical protein HY336_00895 [Candidatus Doudnabacteria bacterium]|nr:hypothetical protein [Candidatus Doudnabacteria bacterium]
MDKLKATQGQKGEAAEVGGNVWHDNFTFEQLMRDEDMINAQIAEVNRKIGQMVVIDQPPESTDKLRIGHMALVSIEGELREYLVGGFEDSEPTASPPVISYLAPLIQPFIGKEEGHSVKIDVGGKRKQVTLERIRMPVEVV